MAFISMRQLLDHVAENDFGLPTFNVNNMEQVQTIMQTADAVDTLVIMQGSAGTHIHTNKLSMLLPDPREANS